MEDGIKEVKPVIEPVITELKSIPTESTLLGVSIRGWLSTLITMTLCYMALRSIKVEEPFASICIFTLGFYFGSKKT